MKITRCIFPLLALAMLSLPILSKAEEVSLPLKKGPTADYGATPWFTTGVTMGTSPMQFALDTGTNLFWATVDTCTTVACEAHQRVNTTQPGFAFIPNPSYPMKVSFGPWGSMEVNLGQVSVSLASASLKDMRFDASIDYEGVKFKYLNWGGGIGLPSESSSVSPDINNIFLSLYNNASLPLAAISFYTDGQRAEGMAILGGDNPSLYDPATQVELLPKKSPSADLNYLWGTNVSKVEVGTTEIAELTNGIFYLDSGSSRFKGGDEFIKPILERLLTYKDSEGNPIFETYSDAPDTPYTGIKYADGKSPQDFTDILPDFSVTIGDTCNAEKGHATRISLSPEQYSYKVDVGDRKGEWVAAFHVLDGVDGLLVGSTFMDLMYTRFEFGILPDQSLTQGAMALYKKKSGDQPEGYDCVPISYEN